MLKMFRYFIFFFVIFAIFSLCVVKADTGLKPSILIYLKNMEGSDYFIDLLTYSDSNEYINSYNSSLLEHGEDYRDEPIYKYNDNGWVARALRDQSLWGLVEGNDKHQHYYTYFGTPSVFKVIIQMPDGSIRVSDVIKRQQYATTLYLDVNTMKFFQVEHVMYRGAAKCILITVIVELIIALLMKLKYVKSIIIVNIITNTIFQILLYYLFNFVDLYLYGFFIMEFLIFIVEFIIYRIIMKGQKTKKIALYTFIANLVTQILTFI